MATRGRKPKPTALKLLEGNPGKRSLNNVINCHTGIPACPDWLEDEAKTEWERMSTVLKNMGMLTDLDTVAFAGYCQAYARWKEAEEFLTQHGSIVRTPNGYLQQVPQVSIAQTNLKIVLKFCEQFGLTPSSRSRFVADKSTNETTDEMEKLLRGG